MVKVTVSDNLAPADMAPLTGRNAHRLADMAGVHLDLRWAAGACAQINGRGRERNVDVMAIEALHDAALIRYGRCFKEGKRDAFHVPQQWIKDLPDHLQQTHKRALDLRDKHIAHSVNDWEVNVPVVKLLTDERTGTTTLGEVSVRQVRVLMLGREEMDQLWLLAKTLADRVVAGMESLKTSLLQQAKRVAIDTLRQRVRDGYPVSMGQGVSRTRN